MQSAECRVQSAGQPRCNTRNLRGRTTCSAFCVPRSAFFTSSRRSQSGLTLMEILIALFIFMLGVLGAMSMFPVAMHTAGVAMGETRGAILARSALDQITADCRAPYYRGTVAGVTDDSLTAVGTPNWDNDRWQDYFVTIVGDGAGGQAASQWQSHRILSNTANTLTVWPDWNPRPNVGDEFVITRLGLPSLPRSVVDVDCSAGDDTCSVRGVTWLDNEWNGYTLLVLDGPAQGQRRLIRDTRNGNILDLVSGWVAPAVPRAGDRIAIVRAQPHDGFIREIPDAMGSKVRVGRADDNYDNVTALNWTSDNYSLLPPFKGSFACDGGTANTLECASAAANWRGMLVRLASGDGQGQVRLVTDVSGTTVRVYPEWVVTPSSGNEFDVLSQTEYFLVITTGRSAGRAFRIDGHSAHAAGDELDCGTFAWLENGVREAHRRVGGTDEWKVRNASAFLIAGSRSWLGTVFLKPRPGANPGEVKNEYEYCFDTFGWPKADRVITGGEPQTGPDFSIRKASGTYRMLEDSTFSIICIFGDSGALPDGAVRVDILVYRDFDSARPLNQNRQPVAFLTGYVGRP